MVGLYFLASLGCLAMIIRWFMLNDGKEKNNTTTIFRVTGRPSYLQERGSVCIKTDDREDATPADRRNPIF